MTRSDIIDHLIDVYKAKNNDYGNSAHRTFVEFGEVALVIRISDKLSRLQSLLSGEQQVKDESILDTIGDAITYLCMLCGDMACDEPALPEEERLEVDDNIDETLMFLDALTDGEETLRYEDVSKYREILIAIYRSIIDPDLRLDNYLFLAGQLVTEYEWRTKYDDGDLD